MTIRGLRVDVLRTTLGDYTNGGVTSRYDTFILIGDSIPGTWEPRDDDQVLWVHTKRFGGETYVFAAPTPDEPTGRYMAGGNFVYSCGSAFRQHVCAYPISVHDRTETRDGGGD